MIPKSGDRFSDKIMFKKSERMIPKSGDRFPACAKPRHRFVVSLDASAGEGRSDKIMVKQKARAG
jgi:hypothetical protein